MLWRRCCSISIRLIPVKCYGKEAIQYTSTDAIDCCTFRFMNLSRARGTIWSFMAWHLRTERCWLNSNFCTNSHLRIAVDSCPESRGSLSSNLTWADRQEEWIGKTLPLMYFGQVDIVRASRLHTGPDVSLVQFRASWHRFKMSPHPYIEDRKCN